MTSTDRLAEQAAEIERLRARVTTLLAETHWLRSRIAELESGLAVTFGTLAKPTPDEPATITHDHPPSAPPHDE
jgi:hypothetical protein